ncbi:HD-GYP domain-containing protein [Paenibacillus sp. D9]|nr:HD-GYP domain-containing protein [Paenibacillus sp. D9]KKC48366.1 HD family phosphohydrolase [Paenibacillus sp. D9]
MITVDCAQLKLGDVISQDVLTPLGGVLFHKGRVVTMREMDILTAFMVQQVAIERGGAEAPPAAKSESKPLPHSGLTLEYDSMVALLKKAYGQVAGGAALPILELRTGLEKLLSHSRDYQVLSFSPRHVNQEEFYYHSSVLSALTCYQLAQWAGLPSKDWMQVAMGGLLHDIGNVKVDRTILAKPGILTSAEQEEMKRHTLSGYSLLKGVAALNEGAKLSALQHHERIDGSGYPLSLSAENIHPYAKMVAIADIFHAMTLNKIYRRASSPYLVLEQIQQDAFGKLDPSYVRTFIEKATQFHNGTLVRLSDGRVGEIVFTDRNHSTRPWVSVDGSIVDLSTQRRLHIEEVLS